MALNSSGNNTGRGAGGAGSVVGSNVVTAQKPKNSKGVTYGAGELSK